MKVALVCIAKNEDKYIDEWVDYHLKLGFDEIFVYQNNWSYKIRHEKVRTISISGEKLQISTYNNFINQHHYDFDWAAFFDVDEFLVLKKHNTIKEFISEFNDADAIAVNWVVFGDNGSPNVSNNDYGVLKRFTKRESIPNRHIKTILKLKEEVKFKNPHSTGLHWVDSAGNKGYGPYNQTPNIDTAQLNHYFCKTKEEFQQKINRGRATISHKRTMDDFHEFNKNEIEDFHALNFSLNDNNRILNT